MAPKSKKAAPPPSPRTKPPVAGSSTSTAPPQATVSPQPKTIGEKRLAAYSSSRPALTAFESGGFASLTPALKERLPFELLRDNRGYKSLSAAEQKKFLDACDALGVGVPAAKPESLGTDWSGRSIDDYTLEQYETHVASQRELWQLQNKSHKFKQDYLNKDREVVNSPGKGLEDTEYKDEKQAELAKRLFAEAREESIITEVRIEEEKKRRFRMAELLHQKVPGSYGGDPVWDDVVPLPQDDGEKPLAAIAYSDDYAEAISYLRAVMARNEHSARVLALTAHIIDLNPAHYTVWLYRSATLFALQSDLRKELEWVNDVALDNQKNYQIWHHRQLLISTILSDQKLSTDRKAVTELANSELAFMKQMFAMDSKNYHVWSYRQWLVRRLQIFPSQIQSNSTDPDEIAAVDSLLHRDVRNNSAWSHRFFLVFSDPGHSTPNSRATEHDEKVSSDIIDREVAFAQEKIRLAPQNQSGWNYLKGVLTKGGKSVGECELFAKEFVKLEGETGEGEDVKSSHALDFLADVYAEKGEKEKAITVLNLLAGKYDQVRKNFWEWKIEQLPE